MCVIVSSTRSRQGFIKAGDISDQMSDDQTSAHSSEYHSMSGRRVLSRIFGPTRDKVTGEWRKLHSEMLNDLCSSPYIIRVITSRRMRWTGHEAHMGQRRGAYRVLVGNLREIDNLENPRIDGRKILKWIFRKLDGGHGLD
jgi:hypothetical protein